MRIIATAFCLVLAACSTGVIRGDLQTPAIKALGETVKARCTGIPREWTADGDTTQAEVERYVKRDQADTQSCASASLTYLNRISERDQALGKKQ